MGCVPPRPDSLESVPGTLVNNVNFVSVQTVPGNFVEVRCSDDLFNKNNSKTTTSCNVKGNCDFVNKDIPIPKSTPCNRSSPNDTSSPCVFRHNSSS